MLENIAVSASFAIRAVSSRGPRPTNSWRWPAGPRRAATHDVPESDDINAILSETRSCIPCIECQTPLYTLIRRLYRVSIMKITDFIKFDENDMFFTKFDEKMY